MHINANSCDVQKNSNYLVTNLNDSIMNEGDLDETFIYAIEQDRPKQEGRSRNRPKYFDEYGTD